MEFDSFTTDPSISNDHWKKSMPIDMHRLKKGTVMLQTKQQWENDVLSEGRLDVHNEDWSGWPWLINGSKQLKRIS